MVLWFTILTKLETEINDYSVSRFIDIRYLNKWVTKYPQCFPKFVVRNQHRIEFNSKKLRYEFHKI